MGICLCRSCTGLSKALGDLAGPCMFAVTMGISRIILEIWRTVRFNEVYEWFRHIMRCLLSTHRFVIQPDYRTYRLYCMWISVGMWPGTISISQKLFQQVTAMFSLLAMAGDLGGSIGPGIVGRITRMPEIILDRHGIRLIFPVILLFMLFLLHRKIHSPKYQSIDEPLKVNFSKPLRSIKPILDSKVPHRLFTFGFFLSCNFSTFKTYHCSITSKSIVYHF